MILFTHAHGDEWGDTNGAYIELDDKKIQDIKYCIDVLKEHHWVKSIGMHIYNCEFVKTWPEGENVEQIAVMPANLEDITVHTECAKLEVSTTGCLLTAIVKRSDPSLTVETDWLNWDTLGIDAPEINQLTG